MVETAIFENKIRLLIYGPDIEITDADCNFSVEFTDEKEPNSCKLRIFNLNEINTDVIMSGTEYVEIFTNQYGLKDSDGSILWQSAFAGVLREATKKTKKHTKFLSPAVTNDKDESDEYIEIDLQEGDGRDIGTFASKSYKKGFSTKKILADLAQSIDMEIIFDPNVKNFNLPYPIILHDNVRNSLTQVASYLGCICTISNNRAYIVSKNPDGLATYFQFDEENIQQPKYLQDKKIEFTAMYMPTIVVGSFVRLVNKRLKIDGIYQVCKIESAFSNHSEDCETKITVKY